MCDRINRLPLEIIIHILSYLPYSSLLAFGETCRFNYQSHIMSLRYLRLGVFEKRAHSTIACLQAGWAAPGQIASCFDDDDENDDDDDNSSEYTVAVIHPKFKRIRRDGPSRDDPGPGDSSRRIAVPRGKTRSRTQEEMIRAQNKIFSLIVNRYGPTLIKLEFMAYGLDARGARTLGGKCRHSLRHLALRFEHRHIRDGEMNPSLWLQPAPASSVWNLLIGEGRYKDFGISSLESLILERSGVSPSQLTMLVKNNPRLRVMKLRTCRGAHPEFLNWLGGIHTDPVEPGSGSHEDLAPGRKLTVFWLENCHELLTQPIDESVELPAETSCRFPSASKSLLLRMIPSYYKANGFPVHSVLLICFFERPLSAVFVLY
ncbi:hypothetical protein P170DRAFT_275167 [Aspergillus steynii IBT 23096]|uniref:F-box domain-containing protein n=1 Tax=Aspergillus steynii IBT 23096 TaxID=1392250 RepID=A0A2I2FX36_9EURO|nr:uncharacterized protein P170DRAFT_275167 [Aspergillus steynii IBT 23096]PLB45201.1 hypothetical protein P170DRAFT_275167 [Aspergillus steynii IBT 23096]